MNIRDLSSSAPLGRSMSDSSPSAHGVRAAVATHTRPGAAPVSESLGGLSSILTGLQSRLESTPDVRQEAVAAARAAVESGELLSRDAAVAAARGFVDHSSA